MLKQGRALGVSLAPSYVCAFDGARPGEVVWAIRRLGFSRVEETSSVLPYLIREREEQSRKTGRPVISTSCPRVVDLVRREFPTLAACLFTLPSPMVIHTRDMRRRSPGVVFVGPCTAKASEAEAHPGSADAVLTFEELAEWLCDEGITLGGGHEVPEEKPDVESPSWIAASLLAADASGLDSCRRLFEELSRVSLGSPGSTPGAAGAFVEALACEGGCLGGEGMVRTTLVQDRRRKVVELLGYSDDRGKLEGYP
ncbi:MAG: hypothetical protein NUV93_07040 [Firmicutes bacterium]|jgi:iron only hydrogenase large subunit-like protein|nr:hypothetical protein [Bacillota bacterium]